MQPSHNQSSYSSSLPSGFESPMTSPIEPPWYNQSSYSSALPSDFESPIASPIEPPRYNQSSYSSALPSDFESPVASPIEPPRMQARQNEYFHYVLPGYEEPLNLYVEVITKPEPYIDIHEDGYNVWVSLEWGIVDWFFNWDKDWDAGGMITREEAIKNIALAYWYDK